MVSFKSILSPFTYFSKKPNQSLIVSRSRQYAGEYPRDLPYARFYEYYHQTPSAKRNINSIHRRWMGSNMTVSSQDRVFDTLWSTWNETVNFIPKLKEAALDALITGTGMLERQYYETMFANIEHIPTKTLWRIYRDEFANILSIWQLLDGDSKELAPKHMIIITINNPERDAVGKSAMYAVAVPQKISGKVDSLGNPINPDRYLPSILDVKTRLNYAHMEIAEKHAKTRSFVSLKGVKDAERQRTIEKDLEDEGSSKYITVTDGDVDIKNIEFKSSVADERYQDDINDQINQATGFPGTVIDKGGEMGYASSQTPMQDLSQSIEDMQNDLSYVVQDEIFKPLCDQWGLDYEIVQPKLVFNTFVEKVTFDQLISIPPTAPISPNELRESYKQFLADMDDTEWEKYQKQQQAMAQQDLDAKTAKAEGDRPDVEKEAPKPEKTTELDLLKTPGELEKYIEGLVARKSKEYFAVPPTDGKPFTSPEPEITNPETLIRIKQLVQNVKEGKMKPGDALVEVDKISKEAESVAYWIKELKANHPTWKHDQVVAVAISKSKEMGTNEVLKHIESKITDIKDNSVSQESFAKAVIQTKDDAKKMIKQHTRWVATATVKSFESLKKDIVGVQAKLDQMKLTEKAKEAETATGEKRKIRSMENTLADLHKILDLKSIEAATLAEKRKLIGMVKKKLESLDD